MRALGKRFGWLKSAIEEIRGLEARARDVHAEVVKEIGDSELKRELSKVRDEETDHVRMLEDLLELLREELTYG